MATGVHLRDNGILTPSAPRRVLLSHGRQTTADSTNGDIPMAKEKPVPNYLKPTMSSCHDTSCKYPKSQQQHAEDSVAAAGARKHLIAVKSMEKPALPSSLNKSPKGRESRSNLSPKAAVSPKIVLERASKAPTVGKTLTRAKSLPKSMLKGRKANGTPSTTSVIKPEQEEKILFIDSGVQGHAARHGLQFSKSNTKGRHRTTSEESNTGKPRALGKMLSKGKVKQRETGVLMAGERKSEQENVVLKRQEVKEKDAPTAYNDVIEETAAKLAERRSKVKALVGAFESVISLQEPETPPNQRQQVAVVKVGSGQPAQLEPEKEIQIVEEDDEGGQQDRMKPEEVVEVTREESYGRDQPQQQSEEEKDEKERGEEESTVQESQQKETEEEMSDKEESKDCQVDQESQHNKTRAKESKGEEHDGVVEDDSVVTNE